MPGASPHPLELMFYTADDLKTAYRALGVTAGRTVYLTGNLGRLGVVRDASREAMLKLHTDVLMELLGPQGTLVVPTHSFSICNTDTPFDRAHTPSETGALSEFIRTQDGAVRQDHAFSSRAALGHLASAICDDCSRHAYGDHTPFAHMLDADALFVAMAMPMARCISLVHQAEFRMGVPYRYTKEFLHPVLRDGATSMGSYYLYVTWHGTDIRRDKNKRIMAHFEASYTLHSADLGRSAMHSLSMREFMASTTGLMKRDIYAWLERPPENRPYQI